MSQFASVRVEAVKDDDIHVVASGFIEDNATIMLLTDRDFKKFWNDLEGNDTVVIAFTDQAEVSKSETQLTFTVPSSGAWHIVFQPWRVSRIAVTRREKDK